MMEASKIKSIKYWVLAMEYTECSEFCVLYARKFTGADWISEGCSESGLDLEGRG